MRLRAIWLTVTWSDREFDSKSRDVGAVVMIALNVAKLGSCKPFGGFELGKVAVQTRLVFNPAQ